MANTLVQFRTDETTRIQAAKICEQLGIDLPTYMKICITRLVQENGIPFSMKLDGSGNNDEKRAMQAASLIAQENGIDDLSLDEINSEISEVRTKTNYD